MQKKRRGERRVKIDACLVAAALAAVLLVFQAARAFAVEDLKPHQQRMRACNTKADAKGLEAGARNQFMRACLNGRKGDGKPLTARQRVSEQCNQQAREQRLQGAERRGFMSECEKPPIAQRASREEKMKGCEERAAQRKLEGAAKKEYLRGCTSGAETGAAATAAAKN